MRYDTSTSTHQSLDPEPRSVVWHVCCHGRDINILVSKQWSETLSSSDSE